MTALTFQPNGDRIDALQVDGEPVGHLVTAALAGPDIWVAYVGSSAFQRIGTRTDCQQAIVRAWAKRFPHA